MLTRQHHALIIGVANYQHATPLGDAVRRDAKAIQDLLTDPDYCAYSPDNVHTLLDGDATAKAIRSSLQWLAQNTGEDSVVTIYFSGHGGRLGSGGQEQTYLLPVDAELSPATQTYTNGITGEEFSQLLDEISAHKLLIIFDCCHAGGIGQAKFAAMPELKRGFTKSYYQQLGSGKGRAIVASSLETESSVILQFADNSLFTTHLLAGLKGAIPSTDGFIRVFELFTYVQQQIKLEVERHNDFRQTPFFQCAVEENFPVALYRSGKKEVYTATNLQQALDGKTQYDFDAYVSYLLQPIDNADMEWVEEELIPELTQQGLKIASKRAVKVAGAAKLDSERIGMKHARRTIVIISRQSLENELSNFETMMAQYMGLLESQYRVIPVYREIIDETDVPLNIAMISGINLASRRAGKEMQRLIEALQSPLPELSR